MIIIKAPAKINLSLHVSAPNTSINEFFGYHKLESLVSFAEDCYDVLELSPAHSLSLTIKGEFAAALPNKDDNLILRAAKLLQTEYQIAKGASIVLEKNLPIASGIGGGSSDCAAAIIGLSRLWQLGLSLEQMEAIGAKLGADVPACSRRTPLLMKGYGAEICEAPKFPALPALLINPLLGVDTKAVYVEFDQIGSFPQTIGFDYQDTKSVIDACRQFKLMRNDLEAAAINIQPKIRELLDFLQTLDGQLLCRMSGSGASCFAIFDTIENAKLAQKIAIAKYNNVGLKLWAKPTMLVGNDIANEAR